MGTKWQLITTLAVSVLVHFVFFGNPKETVFDEVHFGKFVSGYYTGQYYFDIHPPLGKLMIAGFAKLFDFSPEYSFANIGDKFPDNKYLALRFLPALAGTLLPLVIYLLILELGTCPVRSRARDEVASPEDRGAATSNGMSRVAAFAGGLLVALDNALLTQSRLMLLDPFLLLFGFTSFLFYLKYTKNRILNTKYLILNTIFAGLAISIKWTGLSFIALPVLVETFDQLKKYLINPSTTRFFKSFFSLARFVSFFVISVVIYLSIFVLHFALLPKPGPGDAFMKPNFRNQNLVKNIVNLNIEMYLSNQRLGATHPYGSQWYTWPIMKRPIFYWVSGNSRIYFLGNPVVWWSSTVAVVVGLWTMVYGLWIKFKKHSKLSSMVNSPLAFLIVGYWLNLLPFIGIKRVMFLYHYLTALIFAILILCYLINQNKNSRKIFTGIIIASIAVFLFFAPLSYGLPLSHKVYELTVWFASWR